MLTALGSWVELLPDSLWSVDSAGCRSSELTPIYVHRYAGPRSGRMLTAHPFWEMIYLFRGQGELFHGHSCAIADHTLALIPPGVEHYEQAEDRIDILWVGLRGTRLDAWPPETYVRPARAALQAHAEQLWLLAQRRNEPIGPELDALAALLVTRARRLDAIQAPFGQDCIDQAVGHIQAHYAEALSVGELAAQYGYSEAHFSRSFRARTGLSPLAFLIQTRLRHAQHALRHTAMRIEEVARLVGYEDALYFSRLFRRRMGTSPREFRARALTDMR